MEVDGRVIEPVLVDEATRNEGGEDGVRVGGRETGEEGVESDLIEEDLGDGARHDGAHQLVVVEERRLLELVLKLDQRL